MERTDNILRIGLRESVTISDAESSAVRIGVELDGCDAVIVETEGLEEIDASILQLLSSLRRTVPVLSFAGPSGVFLAAVDRCGLRRELLGARREGL